MWVLLAEDMGDRVLLVELVEAPSLLECRCGKESISVSPGVIEPLLCFAVAVVAFYSFSSVSFLPLWSFQVAAVAADAGPVVGTVGFAIAAAVAVVDAGVGSFFATFLVFEDSN